MQKILRNRIFRDLRENLLRYLALGMLVMLGMYVVVSLVGAADTIIVGVDKKAEENKLEDGQFVVFTPMTEEETAKLEDMGISLEAMFYLDFKKEQSTLRVFQNRKTINLVELDEGRLSENGKEIVLEKRYCEENGIQIGDSLKVGGISLEVVGIGSVPDYDAPFKNLADRSADSSQFGFGFVTEKAYESLKNSEQSEKSEEYVYSYRLNGKLTDAELKEEIKAEGNNLLHFVAAKDNPRIKASADDQVINKMAGLIAGVIVMILFTYVISVFVIHGIERESSVIGALYALGVKRKELLRHYLMLPSVITFYAGIIGTLLGYSRLGVNVQMGDCYRYFSLPVLKTVYSPWLFLYGSIMPPAVAVIVNCLVIGKRLSRPALALIKNEAKNSKIYNIDLKGMGFTGRFRIRQMIREARTGIVVLLGMFISLLIMMLGINCYVLCRHISKETRQDIRYEYMYTYKYPEKKVPEGGEACFAKTLKKEVLGYNLDITLLGISPDNPYFDAKVTKGKNKVIISSAMAEKYQLAVGEKLILSDEEEEMDYAFTIEGITQFSAGFYVFMNIDSMRELFLESQDYYNVVFSEKKLDIASERLYAGISKEEINKASDVFTDLMQPMIYMMTILSALIFCVVMYLMIKVMIERSAFGISLMKIFGYYTKEVRKLYLNGNFYIIAIGAAICLPLSKKVMDFIYPVLIANVACGMNLRFSRQMYFGIYGAILLLYFVINQLLVKKLDRMVPADVIKNRE